jgi:hypothetical protein
MTDNVIEAIRTLLKNKIQTATKPINLIKKVYYGDPVLIPTADMPSICVLPGTNETSARGSRIDNRSGSITIKLVFNIKDDMGGNDPEKIAWTQKAVKIMEEMDGGKYHAESIMGFLRNDPTLGGTVEMITANAIEYAFEGKRESPTYEATMKVNFIAVGDR